MNETQEELYLIVAMFYKDNGKWPTNAIIADILGKDRSTISSRVKAMVKNGDFEMIPKEWQRGKIRRVKAI